jgi:RimJ/RimL family protein N-acetyltransferase
MRPRVLLTTMKASASPSLPVGDPPEAVLRPVDTRRPSPGDVLVLTEWRNRFVASFLTEFDATEERTARWLTEAVGPDDTRVLFMVDDCRDGRTIGYMGLAFIDWEGGYGEADAVVRGREAPRGLMSKAMDAMLRWGREQLGLATLGVRVRSDNPAIDFYRKFGFLEVKRVPLRREDADDMVKWVEDEALSGGEPSLVHMALPDEAIIGR